MARVKVEKQKKAPLEIGNSAQCSPLNAELNQVLNLLKFKEPILSKTFSSKIHFAKIMITVLC